MTDVASVNELVIRGLVFCIAFGLLASFELRYPRRPRPSAWLQRWRINFSLGVVNSLLLRLLPAVTLSLLAAWTQREHFGLLHQFQAPEWVKILLTLVVLDFAIWLQHFATHRVPLLWRLHRVHHCDTEVDVSTGLRFHPVEAMFSQGLKALVVLALGPPIAGVLIFELVLNFSSMFSHSNIRLVDRFDHLLRYVVVTPDMHRIHHSSLACETNANYGFNLSCWDRFFGTYREHPQTTHQSMELGLTEFRSEEEQRIPQLLLQPLR